MKNKSIMIAAVAVLVVGAGAFWGGIQYQKSQRPVGQFGRGGGAGQSQNRQFGTNGGRPVTGQILNADDKSITVKMQDGSSKIVLFSDTTSITEATSAGKQALLSGKQVLVIGSNNSDGSVTATNIQLNPQMRREGASPSPK